MASILGIATLPLVSPMLAQTSGGSYQSQHRASSSQVKEPAGADTDRHMNWSWIGLIGLVGLMGLKRHHDVRSDDYRSARTT